MIRKVDNFKSKIEKSCCGGSGKAVLSSVLSQNEIYKEVSMFSVVTLNCGDEVGYHIHKGDMEIYMVLKGCAVFNDNGTEVVLNEFDTAITYDGEGHSIRPIDGTTLQFLACKIKK